MAEKKASSLSSSAIEPLKKEGGGGPLSSKGDQRGIKPLEGAFFFPLVVREEGNLYQKGWGNVCGRGRREEEEEKDLAPRDQESKSHFSPPLLLLLLSASRPNT